MTAITDRRMTSNLTPHTARIVTALGARSECWLVSWLPEQPLTHTQATTAMLLAELVATGPDDRTTRQRIACWAAELDLDGPTAANLAAGAPHILDRRFHFMTTSCWCQPGTALDGHRNEDGSDVEFGATFNDPVDADGYVIEALT